MIFSLLASPKMLTLGIVSNKLALCTRSIASFTFHFSLSCVQITSFISGQPFNLIVVDALYFHPFESGHEVRTVDGLQHEDFETFPLPVVSYLHMEQIGDAIPPLLAYALARQFIEALPKYNK